MSLDWIESGGGPLILLERRLLPLWEGADPPSAGRQVQSSSRWNCEGPATDYDRACDVQERLGFVSVGDGVGLVLNDEPHSTALWRPATSDPVVLVRWEYAENEADVLRHLRGVVRAPWQTWEGEWVLREEGPLLFDSALPGSHAQETRLVPLPPDRFGIEIAMWRPDDLTSLVLIRFSPRS